MRSRGAFGATRASARVRVVAASWPCRWLSAALVQPVHALLEANQAMVAAAAAKGIAAAAPVRAAAARSPRGVAGGVIGTGI
eukprot:1935193-Pleurochrysis_carterae.AAC.1